MLQLAGSEGDSKYPMTASALYSNLLAQRPADMGHVDLKKSSFKKLPHFLKRPIAEGILVVKEIKGELMIMSAKFDHPA